MIHFLEQHRPQGSIRNEVVVVFDGRSDIWGPTKVSSIKVFFTSGETADEEIKRRVAQHSNKKSVVVVTEDREIQCYVRKLGAKVLGVDTFLNQAGGKGPIKNKKDQPDIKKIPGTSQAKITAEMENIWLEKDS